MRTALELDGGEARFLLLDLDERERAAAGDLWFAEEGPAWVKRFEARAGCRAYPRFAACARELLDQTSRLVPARWEHALEVLIERAGHVEWWLGGSAALAVRGAAVEPRDLDLVTSAEGAEELARRLDDLLVEPLTIGDGWIATHFARAFEGARIEWIGNVVAGASGAGAPGARDFGAAAEARLEVVPWRGHELRVPPLELQRASAAARGLDDRVAAIDARPR